MRRTRGFGLVETMVGLAAAGVLAAVALPAWRSQQLRSHRVEATGLLQQVQMAQERFHEHHGRYTGELAELAALQGSGIDAGGTSRSGLYRLTLSSDATQSYRAEAVAIGAQAADTDCPSFSVRMEGALSFQTPAARCWHS